jgi:hypothetical protein
MTLTHHQKALIIANARKKRLDASEYLLLLLLEDYREHFGKEYLLR